MRLILLLLLWAFFRYGLPQLIKAAKNRCKTLPAPRRVAPVWQEKPLTLPQHHEAVGEPLDTSAKLYAVPDPDLEVLNAEPAQLEPSGAPSPLEKKVNADALATENKKNFWQTNLGRANLRRAFVMAEVLGKPRALKAFREEW